MKEEINKLELEKELFEMVYQWGKVGVVTDVTCNAFQDKLAEIKNAALQSFIEAEIARLEGMKKILGGKQVDAEFHANYGFNEAINDQITHLKELLVTLKK